MLVALSVLLAAACGGEGDGEVKTISGPGFRAAVPADWPDSRIERSPASLAAGANDGEESIAVTVFRLARPYKPRLWPRVTTELDRVVRELATKLGAKLRSRRTTVISGRRARVYELNGSRDGTQRIAFVLVGRREYQLLCRWNPDDAAPGEAACATLFSSFRLV